ncbi:hypothetical protein Hdeb2414_s0023g00638741 [Helianthus debilis subsp. tardiflorus]
MFNKSIKFNGHGIMPLRIGQGILWVFRDGNDNGGVKIKDSFQLRNTIHSTRTHGGGGYGQTRVWLCGLGSGRDRCEVGEGSFVVGLGGCV